MDVVSLLSSSVGVVATTFKGNSSCRNPAPSALCTPQAAQSTKARITSRVSRRIVIDVTSSPPDHKPTPCQHEAKIPGLDHRIKTVSGSGAPPGCSILLEQYLSSSFTDPQKSHWGVELRSIYLSALLHLRIMEEKIAPPQPAPSPWPKGNSEYKKPPNVTQTARKRSRFLFLPMCHAPQESTIRSQVEPLGRSTSESVTYAYEYSRAYTFSAMHSVIRILCNKTALFSSKAASPIGPRGGAWEVDLGLLDSCLPHNSGPARRPTLSTDLAGVIPPVSRRDAS